MAPNTRFALSRSVLLSAISIDDALPEVDLRSAIRPFCLVGLS
jgi:hypothetical protein